MGLGRCLGLWSSKGGCGLDIQDGSVRRLEVVAGFLQHGSSILTGKRDLKVRVSRDQAGAAKLLMIQP